MGRTRKAFPTRLGVALLVALTATGTLTLIGAGASNTLNVTTYDYSNSRTGDEPNSGTITSLSAHPRWNVTLNGAVYGQPLLYDGQVLVATEGDTLYSLSQSTGKVSWHLTVGTPVRTATIDQATTLYKGCGDIDPLGITGTPVIDASLGEIFVADETMVGSRQWQHIRHDLIAISLHTHKIVWERDIDPAGGNKPGNYVIPGEQQRPALTLANGRVYVGFGGLAGDCGIYHGFEVGVATSGGGTEQVYKVPSVTEAAIWETNGAVVGPTGNLYVATGNGNSTTSFDGGDALIELSPSLHELSEWAPADWSTLTADDWDLGSAGPIPIPGSSDLFIAGKVETGGSFGYIVNGNDLGTGPGPDVWRGAVCTGGSGDFGADASDVVSVANTPETFIYAACGGGIEALRVTLGATPSFTQAWTASSGDPKGPPIVAGGLVWALDWSNGVLDAMNPVTGAVEFSRSTTTLNHFASPIAGDGLIVVPTHTGVEAFTTGS